MTPNQTVAHTNSLRPIPFKLGRKKSPVDKRTLRFAKYAATLPTPPASIDWTATVSTPCGMLSNDSVGDCVFAGAGHLMQLWTGNANPPGFVPSDADILSAYSAVTGYDPSDPSTDQGADPLTALKYWRNTGIAGDKIYAYMSVNPQNIVEVQQAIAIFGGVFSAVELPVSAQSQVGGLWDVASGSSPDSVPGSWGGHLAPCSSYVAQGPSAITWGQWKQAMTWTFWQAYYDEVWAIVTNDWIAKNGNSPSGFSLAQLQSDLALLS